MEICGGVKSVKSWAYLQTWIASTNSTSTLSQSEALWPLSRNLPMGNTFFPLKEGIILELIADLRLPMWRCFHILWTQKTIRCDDLNQLQRNSWLVTSEAASTISCLVEKLTEDGHDVPIANILTRSLEKDHIEIVQLWSGQAKHHKEMKLDALCH